jgi:dTDP-4-dehydrorhamnose reductase
VINILLTGKTGQVGRELERVLARLGSVSAVNREQMDLADPDSIRSAIRKLAPALIVNAAAYTAVDKAESAPDLAMQVNGVAPGIMAEEAQRCGAVFLHYSTDYVFDGKQEAPYAEEDVPHPLNAYGRSKLAGEQAIAAVGGAYFVIRTSWIYSAVPPNFVLAILKLAREKKELPVVTDQIGSPTWARSLACATCQLAEKALDARDKAGIYHLSAGGYTPRLAFAEKIIDFAREVSGDRSNWAVLRPVTTAQYPLPATRPLNSATSKEKIRRVFGISMANWEADLRRYLEDSSALPLAGAGPQSRSTL